jgi:hypothetical protein
VIGDWIRLTPDITKSLIVAYRMFEKFWANIIWLMPPARYRERHAKGERYYTNQVHLRGLAKN